MTPLLNDLVAYADDFLRARAVTDYPGAHNGLQLESDGPILRIGAAVDACEAVIEEAVRRQISLLIVHHGLLWTTKVFTGAVYRKLKAAMGAGMAIYSSHLPLDLHATLGNNALLCQALGLGEGTPAFPFKGQPIGLKVEIALPIEELRQRLERVVGGPVHLAPGGPAVTRCIGIVTGGAGGEVAKAFEDGMDTFITGEGPHHSYTLAEELGVNLLYGGHYATETFGVKALAAHLAEKYGVPWEFIDHPTGL